VGQHQVARFDHGAMHHDHAVLDDIAQFTHVAGPAVLPQALLGLVGERQHGFAVAQPVRLEKVAGQHQDIVAPIAQRRRRQLQDAQPEEQVGTKAPLAHHLLQVAVRGGDDAHRDLLLAHTAQPANPLVLEQLERFTCSGGSISLISSRNSVPPLAPRRPSLRSRASVKAPRSCRTVRPEQLGRMVAR
jgi:hypothetical protein